jgi:hypothetical protein
MTREVDERKKRAALRKLRRASELAERGLGPPLSDWERAFLDEVEGRIEKYGSAFADSHKGQQGEALSSLQHLKLKEIDKKARGKGARGLKARKPMGAPRQPSPKTDDDIEAETPARPAPPANPAPDRPSPGKRPALVPASSLPAASNVTSLRRGKPRLTVIEGGGQKNEN